MVKYILKIILTVITALYPVTISAQQVSGRDDILRTVAQDRELASGHERQYDFDTPALAASPDGYVPFYISHYGRHGSRYAWDPKTYKSIYDAFQKGATQGVLTAEGKKLMEDYMAFCPGPMADYGCLVPLGSEQHRKLAERMAANFPEVFSRRIKTVYARASTSHRAVASMNAFTLALQKKFTALDIETTVLTSGLAVTKSQAPAEVKGPFYLRGENSASLLPPVGTYLSSKIDTDSILKKFFTSSSKVFGSSEEKAFFCISLYYLWSGYHNYSDSDFLEGLFSRKQIAQLWEAGNYKDYKATVDDYHMDIYNLLTDIISRGDSAISDGNVCADLRFGHDVVISMLLMELNIGTMGGIPENPDDVKNCFQNYNVPMASNVQFILYGPITKMNAPVLFKLLVNEREVEIPALKPVTGPYYDWKDFKSAYGVRP